jgi:hypothetical protein
MSEIYKKTPCRKKPKVEDVIGVYFDGAKMFWMDTSTFSKAEAFSIQQCYQQTTTMRNSSFKSSFPKFMDSSIPDLRLYYNPATYEVIVNLISVLKMIEVRIIKDSITKITGQGWLSQFKPLSEWGNPQMQIADIQIQFSGQPMFEESPKE